jgi:hypothetical protein
MDTMSLDIILEKIKVFYHNLGTKNYLLKNKKTFLKLKDGQSLEGDILDCRLQDDDLIIDLISNAKQNKICLRDLVYIQVKDIHETKDLIGIGKKNLFKFRLEN